jgi:putative sterol carrier protein
MAKTGTTADATAAFFESLATRGHEPLLARTSGTLRFELRNGRRTEVWYVAIKKGDIAVSHENTEADTVIRADKALFDGLATGRVNAMAATLRGVLKAEGNLGLVMSFQRLFPGPPGSRRRKT